MLDLLLSWLQHVRCTCVVVHNGNRKDLESHLITQIFADPVVLDGFLEFGDAIVVLVGQLPPIRAELTNVVHL